MQQWIRTNLVFILMKSFFGIHALQSVSPDVGFQAAPVILRISFSQPALKDMNIT